jgi:MFS transporter, AAHS family, 4-hydroxybenzoate transporter
VQEGRATAIEVQRFIDEHPLSRRQLVVFALCFLVMAVDGYDTFVVGYIAPILKTEWGLFLRRNS